MLKTTPAAETTTRVVLLFNKRAASHLAARLHAEGCQMVNTAGDRVAIVARGLETDADVALQVADLNERQFPVKRCKCLRGAK